MRLDWTALSDEQARWRRAGLALPLWWRDDDAQAPSGELDRLGALAARLGLPLHLAVIPRGATDTLARWCADRPEIAVLVHGWRHRNHAPETEKKAEFGAHRPLTDRLAEARSGLERLERLFGARLAPVFVPPWNRIAADMIPKLPSLGYRALSVFAPRPAPEAAPGLAAINTHLDPIDWRGSRGLIAPQALIAQMARDLAARRAGRADPAEPYGILTHHLVHDGPIWDFAEALLGRLLDGGAEPWSALTLAKGAAP